MSTASRATGRFLGSEMLLILGRRRNQVGLVVLAVVPILITIAVYTSGGDDGPPFMSLIEGNGLYVAHAALMVEIVMFLPMAVALTAGDAIAGEAHLGTLRYLLAVPVGRTRLLLVKYVSLCLGALLAVTLVAVVGAVAGVMTFGGGGMMTLSGSQLGLGAALGRLLLTIGYLTAGLCAIAAVGLLASTITEQPIAVTVVVMLAVVLSTILGSLPQLDWLHPWLITSHWLAVADLLRDPIAWDGVLRGLGLDLAYIVVFGAAAWARFTNKDVTQ